MSIYTAPHRVNAVRAAYSAKQILRAEYGSSTNVMTPNVLDSFLIGPNVAVELSTGTGLDGEPIWGVSVAIVRPDGTTYRPGVDRTKPIRSGLFFSRADADTHVETMRDLLRKEVTC